MPRYADLHILPHPEDTNSCQRIAKALHMAGYSTVGLTLPTGLFQDRVVEIRNAFRDNGLDVFLRLDLSSRSREELLRSLRRFRNGYDIIAVKCSSARVAHVACRDRRVDLVFFDHENLNFRFTHALANLLQGALEMNLASIMPGNLGPNIYVSISKQFDIANEHRLKVVLSSGADRSELIRSPIQVAALASTLGLQERTALEGVSSMPLSIVENNARKRNPTHIEDGVQIVPARVK